MNPENLEKLFLLHLKLEKIKFSTKGRVYEIDFTKKDAELYGKKVKCTFDPTVAKEKKVELLGRGSLIFDTIVGKYLDGVVVTDIEIKKNRDDLMLVNENLSELKKGSTGYNIDEKLCDGEYCLFRISFKTAAETKQIIKSFFLFKEFSTQADGFESLEFEKSSNNSLNYSDNYSEKKFKSLIESTLKDEISEANEKHKAKVAELVEIVLAHAETQYKEIHDKLNIAKSKIEDTRDEMVRAPNFTKKAKLNDKIKRMTQKLRKSEKSSNKKKDEIKKLHDVEIEAIRKRKFIVEADPVAYASVKMPVFTVVFKDNSNYFFIPCISKFIKG
jgi:hypothetical protein